MFLRENNSINSHVHLRSVLSVWKNKYCSVQITKFIKGCFGNHLTTWIEGVGLHNSFQRLFYKDIGGHCHSMPGMSRGSSGRGCKLQGTFEGYHI